jgi:hypothetical protein
MEQSIARKHAAKCSVSLICRHLAQALTATKRGRASAVQL